MLDRCGWLAKLHEYDLRYYLEDFLAKVTCAQEQCEDPGFQIDERRLDVGSLLPVKLIRSKDCSEIYIYIYIYVSIYLSINIYNIIHIYYTIYVICIQIYQ